MKFSCSRAILTESVATAGHAVPSRTSNSILEGVLLELHEDQLQITGFNTETAVRCTLPVQGEQEGRIVLPFDTFRDILRKLGGSDVHIEVNNESVVIAAQDSSFNILGMKAENYPTVSFIKGDETVSIPQKTLRSLINQTVFAVSQSETRPVHTGCIFNIEQNVIEVVGVDGYRLALRREPFEGSGGNHQFVVPGKTLIDVSRIFGDREITVELFFSGKNILFAAENIMILTRTLEGEFLNYKTTIPTTHNLTARIDVKMFVECVERASLLISERQRSPVRIAFGESEAKITCSSPLGRLDDRMPIELEGGAIEMGFNDRFLLDAVKNTGESELRFEMTAASSPLVIKPVEGDHFVFLVLPVRMKTD